MATEVRERRRRKKVPIDPMVFFLIISRSNNKIIIYDQNFQKKEKRQITSAMEIDLSSTETVSNSHSLSVLIIQSVDY